MGHFCIVYIYIYHLVITNIAMVISMALIEIDGYPVGYPAWLPVLVISPVLPSGDLT